jgi:hypothetical protein
VSLHIVELTFVTLCFCFRIGDADLEQCLHSTFQKEYRDTVRKSYLCIIHAVKLYLKFRSLTLVILHLSC